MLYSELEIRMLAVLEQVITKKITIACAAVKLSVTKRTIHRRLKRYRTEGVEGLSHKNRGKISPRSIPKSTWEQIDVLLTTKLEGFSPTHATEKLNTVHGFKISDESLRKRMKEKGLFIRVRKGRQPYRSKRPRKNYFGQLIQLDGSYHNWFQDRGPKCTLIALIDDATSKITALWFAESESTFAVMQTLRIHIETYGIPLALYSDKHSIYRVTDQYAREQGATSHFQDACKKLDIELIHANSPQAKGRVERLFKFLQDRLISELSYLKISTIEEANAHMPQLTELLNIRYEKPALLPDDAHRPIQEHDLNEILSINETRVMQNDWTFRYGSKIFQLAKDQSVIIRPKDLITVRTYPDGTKKFFKQNCLKKDVVVHAKEITQNEELLRAAAIMKKAAGRRYRPSWPGEEQPLVPPCNSSYAQ